MEIKKAEFIDKDTGNKIEKTVVENIKRTHTHDHNMLCCEVYNHDDEEILFSKMYPHSTDGAEFIICKGKDWAFLPHQYYFATKKSKRPIRITKNFGDTKFKGIKHQSRPD